MANYKFKLKSSLLESTLKPSEVDPSFLKKIEVQYGPVNMEDDFFSSDLEKYYKVDEENDETGMVSHTLIKLGSFDDLLNSLEKANISSDLLKNTKSLSQDAKLQTIFVSIDKILNEFRSHLRKNYPDQYKSLTQSKLEEESATSATPGPTTPYAFKKTNLKEAPLSSWHKKRISAFDDISSEMNNMYKELNNAKNKTIEYYNQNPNSQEVVYPTDLINDYFNDIHLILKQEQ